MKAGDNLDFGESSQLSDEIGDSTWAVLTEVEEEYDTKSFFCSVRKFYLATIKKMLKKFPFGDSLLKDLGILQPEKTSSYSASTVLKLAKNFPQLQPADSKSLDSLKLEFTDFLLSPEDLAPLISTYKAWEPSFNPIKLMRR